MRIEKIKNSNLLQRGQLLVVAKFWRLSNSGLESGPVQYYRHRQEPAPGIHRVKNGCLFRHPRTTNERGANSVTRTAKEILESHSAAFKMRQKRNPHILPTAYDDLFIAINEAGKGIVTLSERTRATSTAESAALPSAIRKTAF